MKQRLTLILAAAATLLLQPALAQQTSPCTLPGVMLAHDLLGDSRTLQGFDDIEFVAMAQPAEFPGQIVITYKVADLSEVPPGLGWIIRFSTHTPPANGDQDYFVAMFSDLDGSLRYVYGSNGFTAEAPAEPRQFRIAGDLAASSGHDVDGTIRLVLERNAIPGLMPGDFVLQLLPTVRVMTPQALPLPFTTNGTNETILDEAASSEFYAVVDDQHCASNGKSLAVLGGAMPASVLALLALTPWIRRRRDRRT